MRVALLSLKQFLRITISPTHWAHDQISWFQNDRGCIYASRPRLTEGRTACDGHYLQHYCPFLRSASMLAPNGLHLHHPACDSPQITVERASREGVGLQHQC